MLDEVNADTQTLSPDNLAIYRVGFVYLLEINYHADNFAGAGCVIRIQNFKKSSCCRQVIHPAKQDCFFSDDLETGRFAGGKSSGNKLGI